MAERNFRSELVGSFSEGSEGNPTVAMIEAGVIADVQSCDGAWCYVTIQSFRGYLEQKKLWGVYANEQLN